MPCLFFARLFFGLRVYFRVSIRVYPCLSLVRFWVYSTWPTREEVLSTWGAQIRHFLEERCPKKGLRQPKKEPAQAQNGPGAAQQFQEKPERAENRTESRPLHETAAVASQLLLHFTCIKAYKLQDGCCVHLRALPFRFTGRGT